MLSMASTVQSNKQWPLSCKHTTLGLGRVISTRYWGAREQQLQMHPHVPLMQAKGTYL